MLARLKTQGNTASLIDEDDCALNSGGTESRDSFDSAQGTGNGSSAALRSQLADIKVRPTSISHVVAGIPTTMIL